MATDDIPILVCHYCQGGRRDIPCRYCDNTGKLFWVSGYSFPYTPEGEKRAALSLDKRGEG